MNKDSKVLADGDAIDLDVVQDQFITFELSGEAFASLLGPVQEIIRVPELVRVPLSPHSLEGLASLRGQVLPIISLRKLLGYEDSELGEASRALVIDVGQPVGFIVDKVSRVIDVDASAIESVDTIKSTLSADLLSGVIKGQGDLPITMMLDFKMILAKDYGNLSAMRKAISQVINEDEEINKAESEEETQLVSFLVNDQEYAVDIVSVKEIVQIPEKLAKIPNTSNKVLGLMTLRSHLVPLVSIRAIFGMPLVELDDRSRVVILSIDGSLIGVVTDSVSQVLQVPNKYFQNVPSLLASRGELSDIASICKLDEGERIISVISVAGLFEKEIVKDALGEVGNNMNPETDLEPHETKDDEDVQFVVFKLNDNEFGVSIEHIHEIVRIPESLTTVPKSPDYVEGVINLRGTVIPVMDQRKRLGISSIERNERQRIMVYSIDGLKSGFIVDAVTEVLNVTKKMIEPSPSVSEEQSRILGNMINLVDSKRMIQIVDATHLISRKEKKALSEIA